MLKILGETLLIATRMNRDFEPDRHLRELSEQGEAARLRREIRLPRFWQ